VWTGLKSYTVKVASCSRQDQSEITRSERKVGPRNVVDPGTTIDCESATIHHAVTATSYARPLHTAVR